jgi:hypothetical protein
MVQYFNLAKAIFRQTEQQVPSEFAVHLKPQLGFEGLIRNGLQRDILFSFDWWTALAELAKTTSVGSLMTSE